MNVSAAMAFLLYAIVNAFTPGPGNILALNTETNYGWKRGKPLFFGIFAGYYTVQILCAVFVYGMNEVLPPFISVMKYIGAVYILGLAIHIALSRPPAPGEEGEKNAAFLKGFVLQFVNAKIYLFGITALTGYVIPYYGSFGALLLFELIIATIGTIATLTWIFLGNLFQKVYLRFFRAVNIVLALVLLECAAAMVL